MSEIPTETPAPAPSGNAPRKKRKYITRRFRAIPEEIRGADLKQRMADNLLRIRIQRHLSQDDMGRLIGIDGAYLGIIERGQQNLTVDKLTNLADALGLTAHELFCEPDYVGKADEGGLTLDVLASMTEAINARVQEMYREKGSVAVGRTALASIASALFDVLSRVGVEQK